MDYDILKPNMSNTYTGKTLTARNTSNSRKNGYVAGISSFYE